MKYYPISLGVRRVNWSAKGRAPALVADIEKATNAVFERDNHTCKCCGFRSEKWQQVLHLNGDTRDFSDKNTLTTCIFCHQCFDLESVVKMESGMLIWLPEMSQAELNTLMRAVHVSRRAQGTMNKLAAQVNNTLYARGNEAKRRLGTDSPEALAIVMRDFLTAGEYQRAQKNMEGIRLLPMAKRTVAMINEQTGEPGTTNEFIQILNYWQNHVYNDIPPQNWTALFKEVDALAAS